MPTFRIKEAASLLGVRDTVMAQVEIQAGPQRLVSLLSREASDELGLEPGVLAVATVKATNVSAEIPTTSRSGPRRLTLEELSCGVSLAPWPR